MQGRGGPLAVVEAESHHDRECHAWGHPEHGSLRGLQRADAEAREQAACEGGEGCEGEWVNAARHDISSLSMRLIWFYRSRLGTRGLLRRM